MNETGREYASALFEIALQDDIRNEVFDSLALVKKVFKSEPQYIDFLMSPAIPSSERKDNLKLSFKGKVVEPVMGLLCVMTDNGHMRYIFDVIEAYIVFYRESTSKSDAFVTSAVELSEEQKAKLRNALIKRTGNKVYMHYKIDPKIMGGLIVEIDGIRYDGSLRHRFKEIKEVMEQ
ncbi:MAG: ATP synthase F1 subunit delta [Clostridiales bacterium]|nr:ATP synthase F1 subunit delta [Clostridiales bacterium]